MKLLSTFLTSLKTPHVDYLRIESNNPSLRKHYQANATNIVVASIAFVLMVASVPNYLTTQYSTILPPTRVWPGFSTGCFSSPIVLLNTSTPSV